TYNQQTAFQKKQKKSLREAVSYLAESQEVGDTESTLWFTPINSLHHQSERPTSSPVKGRKSAAKMGCFGFLKAMMVVFNGIIFLAGAAILGVGIWVKVDSGSILSFLGKIENAPAELSQLLNVGYLLIAIGALLLVIGFLGCCGAVKESKCMLLLFFVIVLVVFIAEVAGAVVILVFRPLLHCCGFYNSSDFVDSPYYQSYGKLFPPQCCPGLMITGCFPKIKQLIDENTSVIVGVALGIAALEV
ncbi:hypothetical protein F7725_003878, partial [Dissostichus mawsoni]